MSTSKFEITDKEFLIIINIILHRETTVPEDFIEVNSMDVNLLNTGLLDSLGSVLLFIWITELFGIDDKILFNEDYIVSNIRDFVITNQTQTYTYVEFLEANKQCI